MFSEEKLYQGGQKTKYWYKISLRKPILRFGIKKNCFSKLPIKMLIKKKSQSRRGLWLPNSMLMSFKTLVTDRHVHKY